MRIEVSKFHDYRGYLRAVVEGRRRSQRHFTLASWARKLSLKSSSTLIMILNGERNPSPALVEKLVQEIGLHGKEADFFRNLVLLEKAKSNPHLRAVLTHHIPRAVEANLPLMQMRYFRLVTQWYFLAIRELVTLDDFREDHKWIQSRLRFHVSVTQVKEAIEVLVESGLLLRKENGRLIYPSSISTTFDVPSEEIRRFHKNAFELCREAVDKVPAGERELLSATVSCKKSDLPFLKKRLRDLINDCESVTHGEADTVYMLQMACVPVTHNSEKP